jgi:hypothetical protein
MKLSQSLSPIKYWPARAPSRYQLLPGFSSSSLSVSSLMVLRGLFFGSRERPSPSAARNLARSSGETGLGMVRYPFIVNWGFGFPSASGGMLEPLRRGSDDHQRA